ncbi:MAG: S-layer homology domain-containing protein, partial [Syntrophomonadaceae bacterium]|nr:S-layer homology domain-containing protein [Syntrophomonadaceae bacterium]
YDNGEPFRDFSYNVVYNAPSVYHNPISHTTPGTTIGNVFIDCDYVLDYPDEYMRDVYAGESGRDILETLNTFPSYYTNGVYKSLLWREKYPERYEFYEYMLDDQEEMYPVMTEVRDNLTVYLEKRMSGRATELPDSATIPTDVKYGRVENNHFLYDDPGFASMQNYDFQLSQETAAEYGIEWLDMSKIGAPGGFAKLERLSDRYEDPLRGIVADKEISVEILSGKIYNMVSLWREVTPGVWVWAVDVPLNGEFTASFPVKPGGTYTAFYHGDANYPPQFMGGIAGTVGAAPPAGVPTFTVEPDHDRWDYFPFDLSEDVDDDSGGTPPSTVYVAGITLTGGAVITEKAGTLQLTANITPGSATDKSVTWSVVSGGEYAAVDDTGCVSAKANGKAVIRATARDGSNVYGEITITITGQTSGSGSSGGSSGGGGGGSATTETTSAESEPEEEIMEQEATPLEENPFISDHIQYLYGYEDGTVQADRVISRAEAAAIFFRLLADANKDAYVVSGLTDLESGAWYYQSVAYLNSQGIISGYPDGSFKPDGNITRAEYAAMVSRFDELAAGSGVAFYDVPNEHWAVNYINSTASKGWVSGFEDGSFRPENNVTRAQVVTIVNPMLGRGIAMEDIPDWAPKYTDLTTAHWAYSDIIEASCAHQYELNEVGSEIWIPAGQAGGETQPDETDGADSAA